MRRLERTRDKGKNRQREDGYRENTLRREGARRAATVAAAAELTEHRISDAVKLENSQPAMQSGTAQLEEVLS